VGTPRSFKAAIDPITGSEGRDSKAAIEVITDLLASKPGCGPASSCEPYRELIAKELERGRNAMGIWQDLVDRHGFAGGYQSVRRFVHTLRGATKPEVRAIIETAAGEECQVDYGTGPMVRAPDNGKYRRTRLFVLTLGCSRKCVRLLIFRSNARVWAELHEKTFRRLGGSPRIVVLDNLRQGTISRLLRCGLEPFVSRCSGALRCDGATLQSARSGSTRKSRERRQPCANEAAEGQEFESLEEAQGYLDHWEERWADTRIHGRTKRLEG
jgi:transposase